MCLSSVCSEKSSEGKCCEDCEASVSVASNLSAYNASYGCAMTFQWWRRRKGLCGNHLEDEESISQKPTMQ